MMKSDFKKQVELLLDVIGEVVPEEKFALKGGTAINLFLHEMPRLSVDIDLNYTSIVPRDVFLKDLDELTSNIQHNLKAKNIISEVKYTKENIPKQIRVFSKDAVIKIETNLILRGCVYPTEARKLCSAAEKAFLKSMEINTASFEDLYAGKFCAALDRQHPRDLFDIMLFIEKYEFSEKLKKAFIVYLISHNRPIFELLSPHLIDQRKLYNTEFIGMTDQQVSYPDLENARNILIRSINNWLSGQDKEFLISFKSGNPKWHLLQIEQIELFPAIKWKLQNINSMSSEKKELMLSRLIKYLEA